MNENSSIYIVPTISSFYGIIIQMYYGDHAPPHIHVKYSGHEAVVDFQKMEVIKGSLPRRAANLVLDWVELHQSELMEDWELCSNHQAPKPIAPLE